MNYKNRFLLILLILSKNKFMPRLPPTSV